MSVLTRRCRVPLEIVVSDDILTKESLRPIQPLLDRPGRHRLHLDLGRVRIPTAGGLGALVGLQTRLRLRGGHLVLLNVPPLAYEVFSLTRLTEVLDVRPLLLHERR